MQKNAPFEARFLFLIRMPAHFGTTMPKAPTAGEGGTVQYESSGESRKVGRPGQHRQYEEPFNASPVDQPQDPGDAADLSTMGYFKQAAFHDGKMSPEEPPLLLTCNDRGAL